MAAGNPLTVQLRLFLLTVACSFSWAAATNYLAGVGKWDITGPAVGVPLMGYGNPRQVGKGIHTRLFSRAFIFQGSSDSGRVVFVSIDACFVSGAVKREVVKQLKAMYGSLYTEKNVAMSASHTHSGPGGYSQYLFYDVTILGYNHQVFTTQVHGIVQSIKRAHMSVRPANLYVNTGQLLEANINRSPSAYRNNPAAERARYTHDVVKTMTVLKVVDGKGAGIGMISWFPVHCTSMNNTNHLVSSDNKGYASLMFERRMNGRGHPDQDSFVASFAQGSLGDVSPNTRGPHCLDSGDTCDTDTKTCNGKSSQCASLGPGVDMFASTEIIGGRQLQKALELYEAANTLIRGPVDFRHSFVDMPKEKVTLKNGTQVQLCTPAMGHAFAAGTTDGPSNLDIGHFSTTLLLNIARSLIKSPSNQQVRCHSPKDVLLSTGQLSTPYLWQPSIVPIQLVRLGQLVIVAVPAEFSTMAGRRLTNAVNETLVQKGFPADTMAVLTGPANEYSSYVTTFEEYQAQRYEGACTIYGPFTLAAYLELFQRLATQISEGRPTPPGPQPPNQQAHQISLLPTELGDSPATAHTLGEVVVDADPVYQQGSTVKVTFFSANPNNDILTGRSFLAVEGQASDGAWKVEYTDQDWETRIQWRSRSSDKREATITWTIPVEQRPGLYRIRHHGTAKFRFGHATTFVGQSREFVVVGAS